MLKTQFPKIVVVALLLLGLGFSGPAALAEEPKTPSIADKTKDAKVIDGLLKLYQKDNNLYAEVKASQFNKDFLVLLSIARGIGDGMLLGGMTWGFGDDWLWQFRKVDEDNIHLVRVNTRFTAKKGSPAEKAVKVAYNDSVLFNLPVVAKSGGNYLVDLTPVFFSDLPQISLMMRGFRFDRSRSTWDSLKGFPNNTEIQVAATYASDGSQEFDTVPDSRGLTLTIHYSLSQLPQTGYQPRLADDRVGYFLTAVKDFSAEKKDDERFIRYINRWDLQKADPGAELSPPKKPIVFWMEKTIPYQYRKPIREGILEWNKAFEKAGFLNAIEVRQQSESDSWDPEDVNYNTFRWITSGAGFAMGPSRVNPRTGQILDADIIFDADFVEFWKHEYETFTPESIAAMTGGPLDLMSHQQYLESLPPHLRRNVLCRCNYHSGFSRHLALGSAVLQTRMDPEAAAENQEKLIMQGLKEVTMHEVGHTLGLRHNFKASTLYSLEDLNDPEKVAETGLTASVMDYSPANLVPKDMKQGDYYSQTIGPYDVWAIEYGYKPLSGGTEGEKQELEKIAALGAKWGHSYATDEDTRGIDSDPLSNRFDLGKEPLNYAKQQAQLVSELWPDVVERITDDGEGYQKARRAFGILLSTHGRSLFFASRYIGGVYINRDHKGDPDARPPHVIVEAAKQREAMKALEEQVFNDEPFQFPPELYSYMASSRWNHWGTRYTSRQDYPVHEYILMWQERILSQLLSSLTLTRLHDSELKIPANEDAFTTAELLERLTRAIFSETDSIKKGQFTTRKPAISSLRRNLQRSFLSRMSDLALGNTAAPEDCQTVAYYELVKLQGKLKSLDTRKGVELDAYTKAHLLESIQKINKVLESKVLLSRP